MVININIETISYDKMRYPTCGDYWLDKKGVIQVRIAQTYNDKFNYLILIHEIVELLLTKIMNIDWHEIDGFDREYEKNRKAGDKSEPGDSKKAPYALSHKLATKIEKLFAKIMCVDWKEYSDVINSL